MLYILNSNLLQFRWTED